MCFDLLLCMYVCVYVDFTKKASQSTNVNACKKKKTYGVVPHWSM